MPDDHAPILIIEDEPNLRQYLSTTLRSHGYRVEEAASWEEGREKAARVDPILVLLDLGLPDGDGLSLARAIKGEKPVPIIVVSARAREEDKILALDMGVDDYVTKPFGSGELLARIRVALRHASEAVAPEATVLEQGGLRIDFACREVTLKGEPVHLTRIEFDLLAFLARHAGQVMTTSQILRGAWGDTAKAQSSYVRVYMRSLRKKLEPDPTRPRMLITELGVGYRLKP
jgi:two-component system, OmpR family, KDP operon response regulator KdpE